MERIWDKAADMLSNMDRSTQHPIHHQELGRFLSISLEVYCNEIWDRAIDILANDDQFSHQDNVEQFFQDSIAEHFDTVWDTATNFIGIDDRMRHEENKSTTYVKDERFQSFSTTSADPTMDVPKDKKDIVIAVMGVTGAGKSSFIKRITGQDVVIGHGLDSGS